MKTKLSCLADMMDEEHLDEIFSGKMVDRWKRDFVKRRNMIAHNKMICRKMYIETLGSIKFFFEKF